MAPMVLSISSQVVHGHVGNNAITPAMHTLGFSVLAIPSILLSNHPAHGGFVGNPISAENMTEMVEELAKRGFLKDCLGVLSGYLAHPDQVQSVLRALELVREENGRSVHFCCDPAMGDSPAFTDGDQGKLYIPDEVALGIRDCLMPECDILTPNGFELEWLSGMPASTTAEAIKAARSLNVDEVALTSLVEDSNVISLSVTPKAAWQVVMDKVEGGPPGAGDMFAALYLARRIKGQPAHRALAMAASSTFNIVRESAAQNAKDLLLIDHLARCKMPDNIMDAEPIKEDH